jgi:predicted signal transduction protein with EAL and GGDEF domain
VRASFASVEQRRFTTRLALAVANSRMRGRGTHALLTVALDGFHQIEVSFGSTVATRLIESAAQRMRDALGNDADIVLVDSDEFHVLVDCTADPSYAWRTATLLLQQLGAPFQLDGLAVAVSAFIGVALVQPHHDVPADVVRDSYAALYRAKLADSTRWAVFDSGMHEAAIAQFKLAADLRLAIDRGEFRLHYQPILDCGTGAITSLEALIRWQHPLRGALVPGEFLGSLAEAGLMSRVGLWVVSEALRQSVEWRDDAGLHVPIAINLSPRQLIDPGFVMQVVGAAREVGACPGAISFELTEEIELGAGDTALSALRALRDAGFRVRIDDFGTGYSSLSYLQRLPVDGLKIDRAFIQHLGRDMRLREIVAAVIRMAHALELDVVAEGVECREQLELLQALGCDQVQGFLFAPPLAAPETRCWLELQRRLGERDVA